MINVKLKDGTIKQYENKISIAEIAKSIGNGLFKSACAAKINNNVVDLQTTVENDCDLEILTFDDEYGKKTYWHTTAHIMAQAVTRLFPNVKLAIGPAIETGFYYDFDLEHPLVPDDLIKIENEMKKIIKENLPIEQFELSKDSAIELMNKMGNQKYKIELIENLSEKGKNLLFRKQGDFVDLCAGPHLMSTGNVKAFKLLNCTGAYWHGDSSKPMLQRIYGISFPKSDMLKTYLENLEEAKRRDHRKLGRELQLFELLEEGQGFPFFLPNGMILRNILEDFWRSEHKKAGYVEIKTPIMLNKNLWLRSGHWNHYKDNMYITEIDNIEHCIKPMNCPGGMLLYKSSLHSYRDFPLRVAELGLVHRHELSGALHGLMRARCFTQDDAHIFMTEDQIESEILGVIKLIDKFYSAFGFKYSIELSTRPKDSMGTDEQWEKATNKLKKVLENNNKPYKINEGDGAFYGPKIDFHLQDCIGRTWQCGTIQLDFQMPERFDLTYVGEDGEKHRPTMVHRVIFGSIERFIGILTEHFSGAFPLWLAPEQVRILPISEKFHKSVKEIESKLNDFDIRVSSDLRNEKIGYKIREAQLKKVPYMVVIGDKEIESNTLSIRSRKNSDLSLLSLDEFLKMLKNEIENKEIK